MAEIEVPVIKLWKELYKLAPRITVIASSMGLVFAIIGFTTAYFENKKATEELEKKRQENLTYNQQLDALNNVQGSLNNLIQFVESQKTKLKESEDVINSLKSEQEKLKPVVEADRKTVNALLELQDQKAQSNAWKERWIGFGFGFGSSILASIVLSLILALLRRRKNPPQPANAPPASTSSPTPQS